MYKKKAIYPVPGHAFHPADDDASLAPPVGLGVAHEVDPSGLAGVEGNHPASVVRDREVSVVPEGDLLSRDDLAGNLAEVLPYSVVQVPWVLQKQYTIVFLRGFTLFYRKN